MTDQVPSGASAAQAAENSAPASFAETASAPTAAGTPPPFGTFGTTRGSGLARGKKRPLHAETSAATAVPGSYQPTALEVIVPQREYKNPFEVAAAPAETSSIEAPSAKADPAPKAEQPPVVPAEPAPRPEPVRTPTREPRPYVAPVAHDPAPAPVAKAEAPAKAFHPTDELFPLESTTGGDPLPGTPRKPSPAPKAELNILPPAESAAAPRKAGRKPPRRKEDPATGLPAAPAPG